MRQVCATAVDLIVIMVLVSIMFVIGAILLPEEIFGVYIIIAFIIIPLVYNYFYDIVFLGRTPGNKLFNISYTIGNVKKFRLYHALFKTFAMLSWPYSLWKMITDESLPYYVFLDIRCSEQSDKEIISEQNCQLFVMRTLATAVDIFVVLVLGGFGSTIVLNALNDNTDSFASQLIAIILFYLIYQMVFDLAMKGRTFGKQIMRLEINNIRINYRLIFCHGICKLVSILLFFITVPYALKKGSFPYDKTLKIDIIITAGAS